MREGNRGSTRQQELRAVKAILEIATLVLPELVTVILRDAVVFAVTLPKVYAAGVNRQSQSRCYPAPLNVMVEGEFGALLASVRLPVEAPAALGLNSTLKVPD